MPVHRLDLVYKAIRAGVFGNIEWKASSERVVQSDVKMRNFTPQGIRRVLREHVLVGGEIEVRNEIRLEWLDADHPFWYRARIEVDEFVDPLFVEIL